MEALVAAREGGVDCQPHERPKTLSLPRGREHQREKLEGAGVPAAKPGEPFDDLGGGLTALGTLEDAVEARARLLQGWQNLTAEQRDQRGGQGRGRLPTLPTRTWGLNRENHAMVS